VAKRFEDLPVWQKARRVVREVYRLSDSGCFARDFELRGQIRRAAVSVVSNIAEGYERDGNREFLQHLSQAKGSCGEVRAQLHIASDLGYLDESAHLALSASCLEVSKMLNGLIGYLKTSPARGRKFPDPANPK